MGAVLALVPRQRMKDAFFLFFIDYFGSKFGVLGDGEEKGGGEEE